MKIFKTIMFFAFTSVGLNSSAQMRSFPGAEGYGSNTPGGRGGEVIYVTNLNDSGEGSLRAAIETDRPRIVLFKVSGTIEMKSPITISYPYITIAGQTAPGDGICIKNYPLDIAKTHDVIVRGIKVRPGIESGLLGSEIDGIEISGSENVILDHCSVSWSCDEVLNSWKGCKNITIQWCLVSEPLNKSVHEKGEHGYCASLGGVNSTNHHNLFVSGKARNPSIGGNGQFSTINLDFRNNVVFNYSIRTADGKPISINMVNNYYKPGPATTESVKRRVAKIDNAQAYGFQGKWYIAGNYMEGFPAISADNWAGGVDFDSGYNPEDVRAMEPFSTAKVITQSAKKAYKLVLDNVGAMPTNRDAVDKRVIEETRSGKPAFGNGIINRVEDGGGYPVLRSLPAPVDSDGDGMPDEWEKKHRLNPNDPSDGNKTAKNGYANVENYINSLIKIPY